MHFVFFKLLLLGAILLTSPSDVQGVLTSDPETSTFIAADGRRHVFHGVNVVEKTHEFIPVKDGNITIDPERGLNGKVCALWGYIK